MISPIIWAKSGLDEPSSPFIRGKTERPLRITFHTSSFTDASPEDTRTIEILRQFCSLPEIEALGTAAGSLPHIKIGTLNQADNFIPYAISGQNMIAGIPGSPSDWQKTATQLLGQPAPTHPESQARLTDLLLAQAHSSLHRDIFITLSPRLLGNRTKASICDANPRSPAEAAKILGLFLRSRNLYTTGAVTFDRGMFYWALVRQRLPHMWRYFSGCMSVACCRFD
ncbi:MAG: hypothetical protein FJ245_11345 [Nitrospira sp.]|nr:hypothetical protein [Nitrospira sp.]